jgi:TPP-dependent pyruvate/acetoin dehydrogenase alpha subunit
VRSSQKPQALIIETARLATHSKGDDTRSEEALAHLWRTRDPIAIQGDRLPEEERNAINVEVEETIQSAFHKALHTEAGEF